ncbi:MAG: hypothetical protein DBY40_04065, partial [Clostridiales bacterium]
DNIPGAVAACRNADAIVLVVGDVYAQYGETKDRADLALSGRQLELYRELRALGIPLVTVLLSARTNKTPKELHNNISYGAPRSSPDAARRFAGRPLPPLRRKRRKRAACGCSTVQKESNGFGKRTGQTGNGAP